MDYLSDHMLINAYHKAVKLELEKEFIELLVKEIEKRKLVTMKRKI
ncbi:sporulation histidine kinase inhibitor Sda [Oceanobacillus sp. Castelsardo]|nr:sporulation histidine kinase inhibitor Sda [Oceanobacillus sp. Castelsardo]